MNRNETRSLNCQKWINHFRGNRQNRSEPDWAAPVSISPSMMAPLLQSLEEFQLGDGGGPAGLIAFDVEKFRNQTDEIRTLVDAWFTEEREHSRLLGRMVNRLGGRTIKSHWSFTAFCVCRRFLGVRFELQILLLTEIVSTAYYRLLRRHSPDAPLAVMCGLILRDEAGHVSFHRDCLMARGRSPQGILGSLWEIQFWFCGHVAASVLWASHRKCLRAIGGSGAEYFCEVRYEIARFVRSLACENEQANAGPLFAAAE